MNPNVPLVDERRREVGRSCRRTPSRIVSALAREDAARGSAAATMTTTTSGRASAHSSGDDTSRTMGATSRERYAVVSCHVERPLDDAVWARFAALQEERPGGFAIAALDAACRCRRPARTSALWLERARGGGGAWPARAPHALDGARPRAPDGRRDRELACCDGGAAAAASTALTPTLFCGGGWYTDVEVAEACAELGYVDCTLRARRPPYLPAGERWATLAAPARVELPVGPHARRDADDALARRPRPLVWLAASCRPSSTSTSTTPTCWIGADERC